MTRTTPRTFFTHKLLTGTSLAVMTLAVSFASAQDAEDSVDEVTVTGIRSALERSLDVKRNARGVVDSISAEDIGKFPDSNLAESLQRVTGVSIDRADETGQGQYVTVRGFGADYNLVTLNGRAMPSSTLGNFAEAPSTRSFDFGNLAPEAVARVDIAKTSQAKNTSGGIGSTINIHTSRPLEAPGLRLTASIKSIDDTSSDDSGDELSALFSHSFMEDKLGVSLTVSSQTINHTNASFRQTLSAFEPFGDRNLYANDELYQADGTPWWDGANPDVILGTRPDDDTLIANWRDAAGYHINDIEQERTNFQLTFQARPFDNLTATLDFTEAETEHEVFGSRLTVWNDDLIWKRYGMTSEFRGNGVATPISTMRTEPGSSTWGRFLDDGNPDTMNILDDGPPDIQNVLDNGTGYDDLDNAILYQNNVTELGSVGLNLEWDVDERLTLVFDYHDSSSESKPLSPYGSDASISTITKTFDETTIDYTTEVPVISLGLKAPYDTLEGGDDPLYIPGRFLAGATNQNNLNTNDIEQLQVNGSYDMAGSFLEDYVDTVDFGISSHTNEVRSAFGQVQAGNWNGLGANYGVIATTGEVGSNWDDALFANRHSLPSYFSGLGGAGQLFPEIIRADYRTLFDAYAAYNKANPDPKVFPICGTAEVADCLVDYTRDNTFEEETTSWYVQGSKDFVLAERDASVLVGLRFEETDVTSSTVVTAYSGTTWTANNEVDAQPAGSTTVETRTGSYDYVLPSIDFDIDWTEDIKLRASYSETITRPSYNDLRGGLSLNARINAFKDEQGASGNAGSGNPNLEPYESINWDLSSEWYYGKLSYLSVGYFRKKVSNWVGSGSEYLEAQGLRNPAFAADGSPLPFTQSAVGTTENELVVFKVAVPVPSDREETVDGLELAVQHDFADSELFGVNLDGYGVIANYTLVDTDANYNNGAPNSQADTQFAIIGISDSYNIIAYYENDSLSARIAYNWRDRFLNFSGDSSGYTEEYDQVDVNVSYTIPNTNVVLTYDGLNLTDEGRRTFERNNPAYVTWVGPGHAKHFFGVRWKL